MVKLSWRSRGARAKRDNWVRSRSLARGPDRKTALPAPVGLWLPVTSLDWGGGGPGGNWGNWEKWGDGDQPARLDEAPCEVRKGRSKFQVIQRHRVGLADCGAPHIGACEHGMARQSRHGVNRHLYVRRQHLDHSREQGSIQGTLELLIEHGSDVC